MKNKKQIREKKIIENAIAHLNGYAVLMKAMMGYNPAAVLQSIENLNEIKWIHRK